MTMTTKPSMSSVSSSKQDQDQSNGQGQGHNQGQGNNDTKDAVMGAAWEKKKYVEKEVEKGQGLSEEFWNVLG